ncbi:MAG: HAMP domain-containing sensor histidine kinase, partial [Bacteroidales bacterium]|nr:HAMP domain-containing sensor histidine kinase [Bacteroidales bacterium]
LDELDENDPKKQDLQLIVDQSIRCKNIVSNLLNFARKSKIKVEEVNICEFIQKTLNSVVIPENINTDVKCQIKDKNVMIDTEQMTQALTNLEKNAVEAMPNGGMLSILVEEENGHVIIYIEDEGIGIPEENIEKLFTPFFTTKEIGKGTGLGLPLVYGIIKMHSGKIAVNSNNDPAKGKTGTTFMIKLPRIN